jgi:hypothetical protein
LNSERGAKRLLRGNTLDLFTFISKLVETLAWPTIVLFVLWKGRTRIITLLDRLENFEGWGAKLAFGKQLDQVEQKLAQVGPPPSDVPFQPSLPPTEPFPDLTSRIAEAELPPAYVVQEAWKRVEQAIRRAYEETSTSKDPPGSDSVFSMATYLGAVEGFKFSKDERDAIIELHNLRNKAVHAIDPQITITDALRYSDLANHLVSTIKEQSEGIKERLIRAGLLPQENIPS